VGVNGSAQLVSATYRGAGIVIGDPAYSIAWNTGGTTQTIAPLDDGTYIVTIKHIADNCESAPESIDIEDQPVFPDIQFALQEQTSCNPLNLNGRIDVSIDESGTPVTAGYDYAWFSDAAMTTNLPPAIDPGNAFIATSLPGNTNYTVLATHQTTGCNNSKTTFLQELLVRPRIELVGDDIADCNDAGSVQATIFVDSNFDGVEEVVAAAGYTFTWGRGTDLTTTPLNTTADLLQFLNDGITTLPVDNYTAMVINDATECESPG